MSSGFERTDSGRVVLRLEGIERDLLLSLTGQVIELVAPERSDADLDPLAALVGIEADASAPDDPALARLLPDAYRDDPEAASDFRRFTERSLREGKVAHARTVRESLERSGDKVTISTDECASWLGFLNDARLALGTRLGVEEDNHEEFAGLPDDDPRGTMFHVYDWLTYLQDSLVGVLLP